MFGLWKRRSLEAMLDALASYGLSLREGTTPDSLFRDRSQFEAARSRATIEKGGFEALLIAMGDDPFDPKTFAPLDPPSDDVWHFDVEFIEDHGTYKTIVDRLCRMTKGELAFDRIADYVDVDQEI